MGFCYLFGLNAAHERRPVIETTILLSVENYSNLEMYYYDCILTQTLGHFVDKVRQSLSLPSKGKSLLSSQSIYITEFSIWDLRAPAFHAN